MGKLAENGLLAIAKESLYGTFAEVGQVCIPVETVTPKYDPTLANRDNDKVGSIFGIEATPTRNNLKVSFKSKLYVGDESGLINRAMFGAPTTTTVATTGKQHVWPLAEAGMAVNSLAAEISEGGLLADDFAGVIVGTYKLSGSNDGFILQEITTQAKSRVEGAIMSPIVYTALKPYTFNNAAISLGGVDISALCDNWTISIDFSILLENFKVGAAAIAKPVLNGRPKVTASLTKDVVDKAIRTIYEAGTKQALLITLTSSEIMAGSSPSTAYSMKFEMPAVQITDHNFSGDAGVMKESITVQAYKGTATSTAVTPLEVTQVNLTASYA